MADIAYIPIRQLHPHPDNPRKELGDLSELAASIKENGVYQNLTVIPGHYLGKQEYIARCIADGGDVSAAEAAWTPKAVWSSEDYTIIIGHRRAAAAQQAGKFELPCSVVDMTEKEQLQTMMVENMQRSDLTVYEQAQGFQMMLDMGDTVECVADRSGFSQSTIRRRIKLLELNHDNFKKAEQRGATLSDFVELNKIEDLDARNRVLETLGTANFNREMQNALSDQKYQHRKAEWIEQLRQFAVENPDANYSTHTHVAGYGYWNTSKDVEVPDDADSVAYCYKVSQNQIDLYKERDLEKENAETAKREEKRQQEQFYSAVYKPAGSVAFAELPSLSESILGNVYNVTDAFTTTANFVEDAGNKHPKGTNVVVVKVGDAYKYDVLAGFVDLSGYVEKEAGKGLSDENFTAALKDKLDGIAAGANKYVHPTHTAAASGLYKTTVDEEGHVTATTPVTKDDITKLGIPAQDTTYDEATTAKAGLMSAADKTKLDGMGATINKAIADHTATDAEVSEMLAEVYGE